MTHSPTINHSDRKWATAFFRIMIDRPQRGKSNDFPRRCRLYYLTAFHRFSVYSQRLLPAHVRVNCPWPPHRASSHSALTFRGGVRPGHHRQRIFAVTCTIGDHQHRRYPSQRVFTIHNRLIFSLVASRECGPDARHWESTRVTEGTAS